MIVNKIKKLFGMKKETPTAEEIYNENNPPTNEEALEASESEDTLTEIEPTEDDKDTMNNLASDDPDYLEYSAEAVGYVNREQQWSTYKTIINYLPPEDSILDFGCGRGDFERYNQTENNNEIDYIGIDMNKQLIDAGNKAYENEVDIRCVNWFELDDSLKQDWCMNINSNNMRYDADTTKSDEEYLYDTIESMYKHANKGILILLSSSIPGEEGELIDNNPGNIFNWAQKKYGVVALDHTISDDLFLIAIYKNKKK